MSGKVPINVPLQGGGETTVLVPQGASYTEIQRLIREKVKSLGKPDPFTGKPRQNVLSTLGAPANVNLPRRRQNFDVANPLLDNDPSRTYIGAPTPARVRMLEQQERLEKAREKGGRQFFKRNPQADFLSSALTLGATDEGAGIAGAVLNPTNPIEAYVTGRDAAKQDIGEAGRVR